eukprot:1998925-Pleurochrysis_carterae.AAC.1
MHKGERQIGTEEVPATQRVLGSDGFDGFLIRNAPQHLQDTYHEVIRSILVQEDYPTEWNEWIAVLMG